MAYRCPVLRGRDKGIVPPRVQEWDFHATINSFEGVVPKTHGLAYSRKRSTAAPARDLHQATV
jgi:hypothetical protein